MEVLIKLRRALPVFLLALFVAFNQSIGHGVHASRKVLGSVRTLKAVDIQRVHRTGYHFQPPKNWINDPDGPMYYKGLYHFFYQYNPKGATWGNIVWAHSVSEDLINWQELEPAIYPSEPFDKYGCWSGSITFLPGDKPIILYTGIIDPKPEPGHAVTNYAVPANYSDPYLRKWIKPANNPILSPTNGENVSAWRDPTTAWFQDGNWKMLIGSRDEDTGIVYLYRSTNFTKWVKMEHPLHSQEGTGMWECPDFYPVSYRSENGLDTSALGKDIKHVLKVSLDITRYDYYTVGMYDHVNETYVPDNTSVDGWAGLRYDYGNYYASKTFFDPSKKRRVLWGWANESDSRRDDIAKGWAGIQLIPRTVWLDRGGKQLLQWPVDELKSLRYANMQLGKNVDLTMGTNIEVKGITCAQADVEVTFSFSSLDKAEAFDPRWETLPKQDVADQVCREKGSSMQGGVGPFGLLILASKDLQEYTPVFFRVFATQQGGDDKQYKVLMCSDASSSSLKTDLYKPSFAGFVDIDLSLSKKISLRSLIDHSVVESFGEGGKTVITSRVYPTLAVFSDAHLYVFNNGSETISVDSLNAWSVKSATIN